MKGEQADAKTPRGPEMQRNRHERRKRDIKCGRRRSRATMSTEADGKRGRLTETKTEIEMPEIGGTRDRLGKRDECRNGQREKIVELEGGRRDVSRVRVYVCYHIALVFKPHYRSLK